MTLSIQQITELPEYRELVSRRSKLANPLALVMIGAYYGFILMIAFFPADLGQPVGSGATSLGIACGLGLIFLTFIITGIYVFISNEQIDDLVAKIQQKSA